MTREEAIRYLEICKKHIDKIRASEGVEVSKEVCMALDMAVKALEAWEKVIEEITTEHDKASDVHFEEEWAYGKVLEIINKHLGEVK